MIELPGYTEQEKLVIAEQYLLKRPFDEPGGTPAGCLAPQPAAPPLTAAPDAAPDGLAVLVDQELSSFWEGALSAGPPSPPRVRIRGRRRRRRRPRTRLAGA